jgi:hypothetical protein
VINPRPCTLTPWLSASPRSIVFRLLAHSTATSHIFFIFVYRGVIKRFHMQPNAVLFVFLGLVCHLVAVLSRPPPLPPILFGALSRAGRWGVFSGGFAAIAYLILSRYPAMDQSKNVSLALLQHHSTG